MGLYLSVYVHVCTYGLNTTKTTTTITTAITTIRAHGDAGGAGLARAGGVAPALRREALVQPPQGMSWMDGPCMYGPMYGPMYVGTALVQPPQGPSVLICTYVCVHMASKHHHHYHYLSANPLNPLPPPLPLPSPHPNPFTPCAPAPGHHGGARRGPLPDLPRHQCHRVAPGTDS